MAMSAQLIWNRDDAGFVDCVAPGKGFESPKLGCCGYGVREPRRFWMSVSRDYGRLVGFWSWLWGLVCAERKNIERMRGKGKVMLGCARKAWRRVFLKARSELRRAMKPRAVQRFTYDVYSYSQNFDEGCWKNDQEFLACAAPRFGAAVEDDGNVGVVKTMGVMSL